MTSLPATTRYSRLLYSEYKTLDNGLNAQWMLSIALLSAIAAVTSINLGLHNIVAFTVFLSVICTVGVYLASPHLRFGHTGWATNDYVYMRIRELDNSARWALMLHPSASAYLAKLHWRNLTYLAYNEPRDSMSYTSSILTRKNLKHQYAEKLKMLSDAAASGIHMPHRLLPPMFALVDKHGLSADTVKELSAATGGPEETMQMLNENIPVEYILAMGDKR